jgi:hypothetical protein
MKDEIKLLIPHPSALSPQFTVAWAVLESHQTSFASLAFFNYELKIKN